MKDGKYSTLGQLESDVELMCRNAQEYNIEGSQIFEDSVTLWNVFSSAKTRLLQHEAQMAREAYEKQMAAREAAAAASANNNNNNESGNEDEDGGDDEDTNMKSTGGATGDNDNAEMDDDSEDEGRCHFLILNLLILI